MKTQANTMSDVEVGQKLGELEFPVTASAIVAAALATNDFENVHHDMAAAKATGVPNIFMNILTTNGLVQRYVTDWCGPGGRITAVDIKLGAPNFAGDTMTLSGEVVEASQGQVKIDVKGTNSIGEHVRATVSLELGETS